MNKTFIMLLIIIGTSVNFATGIIFILNSISIYFTNFVYFKGLETQNLEKKYSPGIAKSLEETIALNRDWLGRENPNADHFNGFFPVWVAVMMSVSGLFSCLAILSGCIHLLGFKGKRAKIEKQNKEYELEQEKVAEHQESRRLEEIRKSITN